MVKEKNKRYTEKITASGGNNLQDQQDLAKRSEQENKEERLTESERRKEFFDKLT